MTNSKNKNKKFDFSFYSQIPDHSCKVDQNWKKKYFDVTCAYVYISLESGFSGMPLIPTCFDQSPPLL